METHVRVRRVFPSTLTDSEIVAGHDLILELMNHPASFVEAFEAQRCSATGQARRLWCRRLGQLRKLCMFQEFLNDLKDVSNAD